MKDVIWKHLKLLGLYNKRYRYLFCPTTQFAILWWDAFSSLELFWLAHPVRKTTFLKTCALCDVLSTNKVVCLDSKKYLVETEEGDSKPAAPVEPGIRASNESSRRFHNTQRGPPLRFHNSEFMKTLLNRRHQRSCEDITSSTEVGVLMPGIGVLMPCPDSRSPICSEKVQSILHI